MKMIIEWVSDRDCGEDKKVFLDNSNDKLS